MSTKVFCDGCDTRILVASDENHAVITALGLDDYVFDLCDSCMNKLDPRNWPRPSSDKLPTNY